MNEIVLITGANAGLGKDAARQLAMKDETKKIYLACRSMDKAKVAKTDLEKSTGRSIFEIMIVDVSNPVSVREAVSKLKEPVDALIMNAGGMGGKNPEQKTSNGVTSIFASNVLGHAVMVNEMLKAGKLKKVAMYASSEGVRGVKKMGMKKPALNSSSADEFVSLFNGSYFGQNPDGMEMYIHVKYAATMWISAMARKYPNIRFISMSPGATGGTNVMDDLPFFQKLMYKYIGFPILMPMMGMVHSVDKGAARYVKAISDDSLKNGKFYASSENKLTGPVMVQDPFFKDLTNETFQENAAEAINRFIN
jgi:NAD(P)-dependent dehydrogenase (short-subunit alcohol dehydrogenase family)